MIVLIVHRIIHWGPPSDVESYIQGTGGAGGNRKTIQAQLYFSKRDISFSFMEESMVSYCKNTSHCRREFLFKDFDSLSQEKPIGQLCCDIMCHISYVFIDTIIIISIANKSSDRLGGRKE